MLTKPCLFRYVSSSAILAVLRFRLTSWHPMTIISNQSQFSIKVWGALSNTVQGTLAKFQVIILTLRSLFSWGYLSSSKKLCFLKTFKKTSQNSENLSTESYNLTTRLSFRPYSIEKMSVALKYQICSLLAFKILNLTGLDSSTTLPLQPTYISRQQFSSTVDLALMKMTFIQTLTQSFISQGNHLMLF